MILSIKNLNKKYQHHDGLVNALNNISFDIQKGEFITITGPSGSGKTTLLLAMAGLIKISSGEIYFKDFSIHKAGDAQLADFRRDSVGFVMQNFALVPYLTAIENVMLPLAIHKLKNSERKARASALLELVGLENRKNHLPREMSSGQQQRIAIARALINKPALILADEPTGNLDPSLSLDILDLLKSINIERGITILMVTHSPEAAKYGTRRIALNNGMIVN
jgi:putative ABC transport system ATP-binding protein